MRKCVLIMIALTAIYSLSFMPTAEGGFRERRQARIDARNGGCNGGSGGCNGMQAGGCNGSYGGGCTGSYGGGCMGSYGGGCNGSFGSYGGGCTGGWGGVMWMPMNTSYGGGCAGGYGGRSGRTYVNCNCCPNCTNAPGCPCDCPNCVCNRGAGAPKPMPREQVAPPKKDGSQPVAPAQPPQASETYQGAPGIDGGPIQYSTGPVIYGGANPGPWDNWGNGSGYSNGTSTDNGSYGLFGRRHHRRRGN